MYMLQLVFKFAHFPLLLLLLPEEMKRSSKNFFFTSRDEERNKNITDLKFLFSISKIIFFFSDKEYFKKYYYSRFIKYIYN